MVYKKLFILLSLCLPLLSNQEYLIDGEYKLYLTIQDDEPYSANLQLKTKKDSLSGKVIYPAYGCEGDISLKKIENKKLYLKELITKKADICKSGEYVFDISNHHIKRLKSYTLENKPYTGTIIKNVFKIDESIKRCQDINSNFDKKEFLSKDSYDELYMCQRWSSHVDKKYLSYYEKLLSVSVKKKDAKNFLKLFPNSSYTNVVSTKLENLYYKDAKDIESIDIYLAKYPSGNYVAELQKRKEELVYKQKNYTISGLETYLKLYPMGMHKQEAQSKLTRLKEQKAEAEKLAALKAKKKQEEERKRKQAEMAESEGLTNIYEKLLKPHSIYCEYVDWSGEWDGIYPKGEGYISCSRYIGSSKLLIDINTEFVEDYKIKSGIVSTQVKRGIMFGLFGSDKGKIHIERFETIDEISSILPNLENLAIDSFNKEIKKYRNYARPNTNTEEKHQKQKQVKQQIKKGVAQVYQDGKYTIIICNDGRKETVFHDPYGTCTTSATIGGSYNCEWAVKDRMDSCF